MIACLFVIYICVEIFGCIAMSFQFNSKNKNGNESNLDIEILSDNEHRLSHLKHELLIKERVFVGHNR